jgi:hypothetical protein
MLLPLLLFGLFLKVVEHLAELVLLAQMAVLTLAVVAEVLHTVLVLSHMQGEMVELGQEEAVVVATAATAQARTGLAKAATVATVKSRFGCMADG